MYSEILLILQSSISLVFPTSMIKMIFYFCHVMKAYNFIVYFEYSNIRHSSCKAFLLFLLPFSFTTFVCKSYSSRALRKRMKFSIKDFFSKSDQILRILGIWSHLLKKPLIGHFIFWVVEAGLDGCS